MNSSSHLHPYSNASNSFSNQPLIANTIDFEHLIGVGHRNFQHNKVIPLTENNRKRRHEKMHSSTDALVYNSNLGDTNEILEHDFIHIKLFDPSLHDMLQEIIQKFSAWHLGFQEAVPK